MTRAALVLLLVSAMVGCRESAPPYPSRQPPEGLLESSAGRAAGAALFAAKCASCHGRPGEGRSPRADFFQPPAPDFHDRKYRSVDPAFLFWRISHGKTVEPYLSRGSVMPAWGPHFSDEQIWQLVAYLRSRAGG
ncbi:hypothetical protein DESUT3_39480 [Desulfuromonas versatilis]|uniref:Cytochrome c domain-containing protein n=1 Tax=Desulfuromonas versatilis TaxID=2802975 RepID=A0ABN6E5F2_9BACT|nr:cytochrome c [Desulfuromonas versatilis]BCR06879.1 hypothetical protein DESUT3_39480 [Desulfuromonas versatilis]